MDDVGDQERADDSPSSTERERLADVLHATLAQELSFISMTARRKMSHEDAEAAMQAIADAADQMVASLRTILLELKHPAEESLRNVVSRLATPIARKTGASLFIDVPPHVTTSLQQKVTLGRIVREAVANAVRHGHARSIVVRVQQEQQVLRLEIDDDGAGFDPGASRPVDAFGIDGMRNSIEAIGGTLHVSSRLGEGTSVLVELP